jgi:Domain of unknown function (DUF4167)
MRPQQQNRRMRGRNNNNRKGPNPLTRSYESNGPDVKIRGSAQQVAEKYAALARDAQSAGDRVMAENYLQHAEHYNRIIAAAQAQMPIQNLRENRDEFDDEFDEEREPEQDVFPVQQQGEAQPQPQTQPFANGSTPQPVIEGTPAEVALNAEAAGSGGERPRNERPNGFHGNGYNGEEGFRRNRRSRRGRGSGRQDFDQQAGGEGGDSPATEAASGGDGEAAAPRAERRREPAAQPAEQAPSGEAPSVEKSPAEQD